MKKKIPNGTFLANGYKWTFPTRKRIAEDRVEKFFMA